MRSWVWALTALACVGCFESEEAPAAKTAAKPTAAVKTAEVAKAAAKTTKRAVKTTAKTVAPRTEATPTSKKKLDAKLFGKLTGDVKVDDVDSSVGKPSVKGGDDAPKRVKRSKRAATGGAGTPQAAFDRAQAAMKRGDHRGFFNAMTAETQEFLVATMVIGSGFSAMGKDGKPDPKKAKELDAIVSRHGVKKGMTLKMGSGQAAMRRQMREMVAGVSDKAGLYADLQAFMKRNSKNYRDKFTGGTLSGVTIKGDRATGTVKRNDGRSVPITFRREGGGWKMHVAR